MTTIFNGLLRALTYAFLCITGYYAIYFISTNGDWTIGILPLGGWLIILGLWLYRSVVSIPTLNYGDFRAFGKRIGRTVNEGLTWRPWWQEIVLYPYKIVRIQTKENFTTKDRVDITISGVTQYQPDRRFIATRFSALSESVITEGLNSVIKEELGILAGLYDHKVFIEKKAHVIRLINCILRMKTPPHINILVLIESGLNMQQIEQRCLKAQITINQSGEIDPEFRIQFYEEFSHEIKILLSREKLSQDISQIEAGYAINIDQFNLDDISWTEEFAKSMELRSKTEATIKAHQKEATAFLLLVGRMRKKGIGSRSAVNAALAVLGLSTHHTFESRGGVMPIIQEPVKKEEGVNRGPRNRNT